MPKKILIALGLVFLVACSSTPHKRSIGEVIDDSVISNKLKVKYLKDKTVKGLKINIDTRKGVVTLKGRVENQRQIDRAIDIAERQPGVKEVKSNLVVGRSSKKSKPAYEAPTRTIEEKPITVETEAPQQDLAPEEGAKPHFDDEPVMDQPAEVTN